MARDRIPVSNKPKPIGGGTVDKQERVIPVANKPINTGVYLSPATSPINTGAATYGGTPRESGDAPRLVRPAPPTAADVAAEFLSSIPSRPSLGGGSRGSNDDALKKAIAEQGIATLRQQLDQPSRYDALQTRLEEIYKQAEDRINAAGTSLSSSLSTPMTQQQFAPAMQVAPVAMSNYLQSIGASGADVTAQQTLSNALLGQVAGNAQQYGQGITQANDLFRQALANSVPANQLAGISNASLNRAAYEARLAKQKSDERKTIQDQILELALKYGIKL